MGGDGEVGGAKSRNQRRRRAYSDGKQCYKQWPCMYYKRNGRNAVVFFSPALTDQCCRPRQRMMAQREINYDIIND